MSHPKGTGPVRLHIAQVRRAVCRRTEQSSEILVSICACEYISELDSLGEFSGRNDDVDDVGDELVLHHSVGGGRRRQRRRSVHLHVNV